jgi:hypothetical protein
MDDEIYKVMTCIHMQPRGGKIVQIQKNLTYTVKDVFFIHY